MKLDERKIALGRQKDGTQEEGITNKTPRSRRTGKNELKNLESELNEEVEGTRNRGKALTLTYP